jgi:S1-C subfamily serine protease
LTQIVAGAPAARAGLAVGDVVTSIGGTRVRSSQEAVRAVLARRPGDRVEVRFRRNGREQIASVVIAHRPADDSQVAEPSPPPAQPQPPGPNDRPQLGVQIAVGPEGRAIIANVMPGSLASRAGLRPGDVILEVNRQPVRTAQQAIDRLRAGNTNLLRIEREGQSLFVPLQ